MLIKKKLKLSILIFTIFSLAFAFLQFNESRRITDATANHELINSAGKLISELHVLNHEFVHNANIDNKVKNQWLKKFKKVELLLKQTNLHTDQATSLAQKVSTNLNYTGATFFQLADSSKTEKIHKLERQVSTITMTMIKQIFDLAQMNRQEIIKSKTNSNMLTLAFCIMLLVLLLTNFVFITKTILKPFSILNKDLQKAAAGELTYRDPSFNTDEFGHMAHTFYNIADSLQWATYSLNQTEQSQDAVNTKAEWAQGLQSLAEELSHSKSKNDIIDIVHSTSKHIEGIKAWPALSNRYGKVVPFHNDKQIEQNLGEEFQKCLEDVFQNKIIRYSGDMDNKPECQACLNIKDAKYCVVFPLMVEDICFGCLTFVIFIDHESIPIEELLLPLLDVFSKQVANSLHRITTQKQLQNSINAAEEANKAKSKFLASMSHEIRNPLNAILGVNYLLLQTSLDNVQESYVNKASVSAKMLQETINDILDFSKIEANAMELERTEFSIEDLLKDVREVNAIRAQTKGLELLFIYDQMLPYNLWGDPLRLGQVINNLISNSIKFTEHGEIVLTLKLVQEHLNQATIQFSVHDNGIGIPKDKMDKLFQEFTQLDSSITRRYGGTGLGLTISKQLVEHMNGKIWAESDPGAGTTFYFTANFEIGSPQKDRTLSLDEKIKEARVLVVGPSPKNNLVISNTLQHFCSDVETATTGAEAMNLIKQPSHIDLIVLDSMVSDFKHEEFIEFKDDVFQTKIILTAKNLEQRNLANLESDTLFDGHLSRPFTPSDVLNSLIAVFDQQNSSIDIDEIIPASTPAHKLDGVNILLVEDNDTNQMIAQDIISGFGANVMIASNGQECLTMLDNNIDLILMDIQMPIMDGYESTKRIRSHHAYKDLPIIAMTASAFKEDQEKALESGMNDYVYKPIDPIELNDALFRWTKGQASELVHSKTFENHPDDSFEDLQVQNLDSQTGLERVAGQLDLYKKLLRNFAIEKSTFAEKTKDAYKHKNWDVIIHNAHALKGTAGNLGAMEIYEKAQKLEKMVMNQQYDNVQVTLNELCQKLQHLLSDLKKI